MVEKWPKTNNRQEKKILLVQQFQINTIRKLAKRCLTSINPLLNILEDNKEAMNILLEPILETSSIYRAKENIQSPSLNRRQKINVEFQWRTVPFIIVEIYAKIIRLLMILNLQKSKDIIFTHINAIWIEKIKMLNKFDQIHEIIINYYNKKLLN